MAIVTGDRYLESLVRFVEKQAGPLIEGALVLKLNPVGLHYVQSRLEALQELEGLLAGAPIDYLRAYVSDLGDHRALEQLRRILRLLPALKVVSVLPHPARDPTPLPLLPFCRLRVLELRGCDLSTSAARGLLELRHTLEKIVCHNSTDALRHVFASRIADIKESPLWNRLTFVSCACNDLALMDESLKLLPAVETVDLSRNKFTKVDNLRKCPKLKHLDLGFNQLRTIESLAEVSHHIVKLVLRNNALATLRGLENLKSLEGLDLSYNVISNFSELEILTVLSKLNSLWLEGNPLCCARWYRAQVFSYFSQPHKLKLDDKEIATREFWKMQLIIASRQTRPASFGFYSPAQNANERALCGSSKPRKLARLACIETGEQGSFLSSEQDSISCDNEIKSREEHASSDDEAEITELMMRIELMKKERSVLWLREFKEWMDQDSIDSLNNSKCNVISFDPSKDDHSEDNVGCPRESSRCVLESVQTSRDGSSTNMVEPENSSTGTTFDSHHPAYVSRFGDTASRPMSWGTGENSGPTTGKLKFSKEQMKPNDSKEVFYNSMENKNLRAAQSSTVDEGVCTTSAAAIDDIMGSHSSCGCSGSPPHYEEDILHRRQNLVEEILQLSADSFSVVSSESFTSESEGELSESEENEHVLATCLDGHLHADLSEDMLGDQRIEATEKIKDGCILDSHTGRPYCNVQHLRWGSCHQLCPDNKHSCVNNDEATSIVERDTTTEVDSKNCKRRSKRRVVSLSEENDMIKNTNSVECGDHCSISNNFEDAGQTKDICHGAVFSVLEDKKEIPSPANDYWRGTISMAEQKFLACGDLIQDHFDMNIGDSSVHETCREYIHCECILEQDSKFKEREVAVLLSSEHKLYVLIVDVMLDAPETKPTLIGCHKVEDVNEVLVGFGLQVVRVNFKEDVAYLFVTRDIKKSRQLIFSLESMNATNDPYTLRSLEQIQIDLLERQICEGSKKSIFQYCLVLFFRNYEGEEVWLSRSLLVIGEHLLVCFEDFMQFGSLSLEASSSPYFLVDSCCAITSISEMVIEARESQIVTLAVEYAGSGSGSCCSNVYAKEGFDERKETPFSLTWKIKWFSEESLLNFVALMKASHTGGTASPLRVKCTY